MDAVRKLSFVHEALLKCFSHVFRFWFVICVTMDRFRADLALNCRITVISCAYFKSWKNEACFYIIIQLLDPTLLGCETPATFGLSVNTIHFSIVDKIY